MPRRKMCSYHAEKSVNVDENVRARKDEIVTESEIAREDEHVRVDTLLANESYPTGCHTTNLNLNPTPILDLHPWGSLQHF